VTHFPVKERMEKPILILFFFSQSPKKLSQPFQGITSTEIIIWFGLVRMRAFALPCYFFNLVKVLIVATTYSQYAYYVLLYNS